MQILAFAVLVLLLQPTFAEVPAAPAMTLYQLAGDAKISYYKKDQFARSGKKKVAGSLAQGSWVVPCLVIHNDKPLTASDGTPYVGFEILFDANKATATSTKRKMDKIASREGLMVQNHHCDGKVKYVMNAKRLVNRTKQPFFAPKGRGGTSTSAENDYDEIVRAFHNSSQCEKANRRLTGRRDSLADAWEKFIHKNRRKWSSDNLNKAKHLDYVMRTAIYEGHIGRGCSAYGACERNIIALSIRNRVIGQCSSAQGCGFEGDFQGAASAVSQYNIWDAYLTQTSGLTSCFLRTDLADEAPFTKLQTMYSQSVGDISSILFDSEEALQERFVVADSSALTSLRHYYHPPAMGACFPKHDAVEFITAAAAGRDGDYILLVNQRIKDDKEQDDGYRFRSFRVKLEDGADKVSITDPYKSFVIDGRKVSLKKPTRCTPYGVSGKCRFNNVERYRKTPFWLNSGKLVEFKCRIRDQGASCTQEAQLKNVGVGGSCDIEMMPVVGVRQEGINYYGQGG
ncbi:hypothetical protein [Solemya elarraichensis gill symbiont]|uniref:Sporulation stage II protein D amidase enhancer LytB N-terminal domain-containing protein n=1 Tax=Solemya elarraichensis gill symbiont TaxID=1918949 RepID=A0A1T2LCI5_9GAMM|nr:hypothetical protein [Solemya elarraichensis gill symbiont]OOZ42801.1 hypothetical protein BOW52_01435 [Solemya elarraichensis gill symbiont]